MKPMDKYLMTLMLALVILVLALQLLALRLLHQRLRQLERRQDPHQYLPPRLTLVEKARMGVLPEPLQTKLNPSGQTTGEPRQPEATTRPLRNWGVTLRHRMSRKP